MPTRKALLENARSFFVVLALLAVGLFGTMAVAAFSEDPYHSSAWWLVFSGAALPLYLVVDTFRHEGLTRSVKVFLASLLFIGIGFAFYVILFVAALSDLE